MNRWWYWRGGRAGFARDLLFLAVAAAVFSGVYALLQLAVYGHVRW